MRDSEGKQRIGERRQLLSLVVPIYNESKTIDELYARVPE